MACLVASLITSERARGKGAFPRQRKLTEEVSISVKLIVTILLTFAQNRSGAAGIADRLGRRSSDSR
jgi:hypothetical protein